MPDAYLVRYHPDSVGDAAQLDPPLARQVRKAIEGRLARAPSLYGRHLRSAPPGIYRIHIRHLRVVYQVDEKGKSILIIAIAERRDDEVYDLAMHRLRRLGWTA